MKIIILLFNESVWKVLNFCKDLNYKEIDCLNEFLFFTAKPIVKYS